MSVVTCRAVDVDAEGGGGMDPAPANAPAAARAVAPAGAPAVAPVKPVPTLPAPALVLDACAPAFKPLAAVLSCFKVDSERAARSAIDFICREDVVTDLDNAIGQRTIGLGA